MKIGIAGVGGIGSNVARHLAQAGVNKIKLIDFDRVEAPNLNRQFYRISQVGKKKIDCLKESLLDIFPGMDIETMAIKIGPGDSRVLFSDCDLVVEGFDNKVLKKMIIEELAGTGKMVVSASGIAGVDLQGVTTRRMGDCRMVGDFVSDQETCELFPPKIALVAAVMAAIVLKHIKDK